MAAAATPKLPLRGTLSPIVPDPERAFLGARTLAALHALPRAGLRTAVITGRSLERIRAFTSALCSLLY